MTFTRNQFKNLAAIKAGYGGLNGYVNETRTFSKTTATTSIFLSHSHLDREVIEQAKIIFEKLGVSVYVDWADNTMPEKTNGITATKIKRKIIENKKFIFLGTNNAVISKWCNWEIGIGDAHKLNNDNFAIIGIADNNGHWKGNEYLQIYPRIEYRKYKFRDEWDYWIFYPNEEYRLLKDWLKL